MTFAKHPGGSLLDNLPVLTEVAEMGVPLHTLTEIVAKQPALPEPDTAELHASTDPQLLKQLEIHLEQVFAHKLNLVLSQLQHQAVMQAVEELKAELPELLREALKARL
jgi:hypothetical protein